MNKRGLLFAGLLLAGVTQVQAMPYGYYDARSVAMGNVSVATGGITTAALSNPGMLTVNENDDTFALLFPAIGVQAVDDGDVIDSIDEFQEIEDQMVQTTADRQRQVEILQGLENSSLMLGVTPNAAVLYSGDNYTWGVSLRANATASVSVTDIQDNFVNPDATVEAIGVMTTEIGLPIGTDFSLAGMQLSVGIMPKMVNVDGISYSRSISDADVEDAFDEETDLGSFTTLDAGVVLNVLDSVRVGLVAKNLLEETKTITANVNTPLDINFDRHLRAGVAFDGGFFTLAADMDLTEIEPVGFESPSKMFSVGAELNTFEVFQLRAGYQSNMASGSNDPDLLSLGVGLWLGFHLDAAVVVGDDSSFGGFIQTGFRF
ncbi:MAG TPA: conjugal transfer protein TraF [Gammaproteobacteria bacterium]